MVVQTIITNWDEYGDSVIKFGSQQTGLLDVTVNVQPTKTVLNFRFDSIDAAQAADLAISTFARGLGYHLG